MWRLSGWRSWNVKKSTSSLELVTPVPDENAVKNAVISYLTLIGALVLRVNSGAVKGKYEDKQGRIKNRFWWVSHWFAGGISFDEGKAGISDILCLLPSGKFAVIECKTPQRKDEVTEAQRRFMAEVEARGGVAVVASDVSDVQAALEEASDPTGTPKGRRRGEGK